MSNSYETTINGFPYFKKETTVYEPIQLANKYSITGSLPDSLAISNIDSWEVLYNYISDDLNNRTLPKPPDSILNDDVVKQFYLNIYSEVLQTFITSGKNSSYLRDLAVTGSFSSDSSLTGIDIFKQSKFFQILDIQELKESIANTLLSNPCFVMDSKPDPTINALKLELMKANFRLLCRTIVLSIKLQNVFLTSVFNNNEFYKSNNLFDSSLIDYAYEILKQKMSSLIPQYKESIEIFLFQELKKKLDNGEDILDPISNEIVEFATPLNDSNLLENVDKYLKTLFINEFIFVTNKTNEFFNLSGTDPESQQKFYLAPTNNFGTNKLFISKEYFLDNLLVTGVSSVENAGSGVSDFDINVIKTRDKNIFLELSSDVDNESNTATITLKIKVLTLANTAYERTTTLCSVKTQKTSRRELSGATLNSFMLRYLTELKTLMLTNEDFLTLTNFIFPLNKILNISSLFYINLMNKTYENLNTIFDGSIKTIANIHDMILGNEEKTECSTENPTEIDLENMLFGVNLEILKQIAVAPLDIIKGMEETFDPNISIASKIRTFAESLGAPKLPIIPYSLGLAPALTFPPPYGIGPPLISPWGYIYWGIDAAEVAVSYAKDGFNTNSIKTESSFDFDISKDPLKPNC